MTSTTTKSHQSRPGRFIATLALGGSVAALVAGAVAYEVSHYNLIPIMDQHEVASGVNASKNMPVVVREPRRQVQDVDLDSILAQLTTEDSRKHVLIMYYREGRTDDPKYMQEVIDYTLANAKSSDDNSIHGGDFTFALLMRIKNKMHVPEHAARFSSLVSQGYEHMLQDKESMGQITRYFTANTNDASKASCQRFAEISILGNAYAFAQMGDHNQHVKDIVERMVRLGLQVPAEDFVRGSLWSPSPLFIAEAAGTYVDNATVNHFYTIGMMVAEHRQDFTTAAQIAGKLGLKEKALVYHKLGAVYQK